MCFKKTLIFSVFLHLCFWAAVLLFASGLIGGSSNVISEKVFFVKLTTGTFAGDKQAVAKIKETQPERSRQTKVKRDPTVIVEKKTFSIKELNIQQEPVKNILLASYEGAGSNIIAIPYNQHNIVNISYNSGMGISEGRGTQTPGVLELIRDSIERAKTYPFLARKRGLEGTVHISFRVDQQGKPQDIKIVESSGSSLLDKATMDTVKKAAPFPYMDSSVEVPVVYRLN